MLIKCKIKNFTYSEIDTDQAKTKKILIPLLIWDDCLFNLPSELCKLKHKIKKLL